ncbi:MAG: phenylalanine--tRNA ligase subunit beta [Spirochaetes bacterium]|nr:phenylalanine--tRNA ligase subunit beta [Spirochaetota bacterium]
MKVPLSWLSEFVDLEGIPAKEIANKITLAGAEVSGIETIGGEINGVFIGRIRTVEKHPNADKLSLCEVDLGPMGVKKLVCGAPNVKVDALVPVAVSGTTLPGGHVIKKAKIRGIESDGMIASKEELGLEASSDGIWLIEERAEVGASIMTVIGKADHVFEFEITANRGDLLSVIGLARELAAVLDRKFHVPEPQVFENKTGNITISLEDHIGCPRYAARLIKGMKIGPSPAWLAERLTRAGLRPVNNVVDVTNYVMLEFGQPLHAFDLNKLGGKQIVIRRAKKGETITVIDGSKHELDDRTLVIADAAVPIAVAGVMGGSNSEIDNQTTDMLLESAFFDPVTIRKGSKLLGLASDASYRFERGINIAETVHAMSRAVELIIETAGGVAASTIKDIYPNPFESRTLVFDCALVKRHVGIALSRVEVHAIFKRLGFAMANIGENSLRVDIPVYRPDITADIDLVEEVARLYGYNELPSTLPRIVSNMIPTEYAVMSGIKHMLVSAGLTQLINFSMGDASLFTKAGFDALSFITVKNPLSSDYDILRPDLFVGIMQTLSHNRNRGSKDVACFELGAVFTKNGDAFVEKKILAGAFMGKTPAAWNTASRPFDFFDAAGITEELMCHMRLDARRSAKQHHLLLPSASAAITVGDTEIGYAGEVTPSAKRPFDVKERVFYFAIDVSLALTLTPSPMTFTELWKFPPVYRDLALVCDRDFAFAAIVEAVRNHHELVRDVTVMDVYQGEQVPEGKRSVAVSLVYNDPAKTLSDEAVDKVEKSIVEMLKHKFGAALRA